MYNKTNSKKSGSQSSVSALNLKQEGKISSVKSPYDPNINPILKSNFDFGSLFTKSSNSNDSLSQKNNINKNKSVTKKPAKTDDEKEVKNVNFKNVGKEIFNELSTNLEKRKKQIIHLNKKMAPSEHGESYIQQNNEILNDVPVKYKVNTDQFEIVPKTKYKRKIFHDIEDSNERINNYKFRRILYPVLVNKGIKLIDKNVMSALLDRVNDLRVKPPNN